MPLINMKRYVGVISLFCVLLCYALDKYESFVCSCVMRLINMKRYLGVISSASISKHCFSLC